jgi:hypothetical protein
MLVTGSYVEDQPSVMNIRDEFARAALQGFCANPEIQRGAFEINYLAMMAYDMADAMMEERSKRP